MLLQRKWIHILQALYAECAPLHSISWILFSEITRWALWDGRWEQMTHLKTVFTLKQFDTIHATSAKAAIYRWIFPLVISWIIPRAEQSDCCLHPLSFFFFPPLPLFAVSLSTIQSDIISCSHKATRRLGQCIFVEGDESLSQCKQSRARVESLMRRR